MHLFKRTILLILILGILIPCHGQLSINEFQASNINTILDPSGNYLEWVEIYNDGNTWIDLEGYYLTDDLNDPYKCRIGALRVYAKSSGIIWLHRDGDFNYCQMKLDMEGEEIGLFNPSGQLLDSVRFNQQYLNISQGRQPDGLGDWFFFDEPTPGSANDSEAFNGTGISADVQFSISGGFYQGSQELILTSESDGDLIRYTLDGSWPTKSSPLYSSPLIINQTTVVRARTFANEILPGNVNTQTYILNDNTSLPVVSISSDPEHFFSNYTGIYVEGYKGISGNCSDVPVNWNLDWERPINFEYFTSEGIQEVNQQTGTKITGGCSRTSPFKSMAVIARKKYGKNRLNYKFFASKEVDEFKSLVLRNSGSDSWETMFRDGFMQSLLVGQMDIDLQGYQPAIVYLNGEYWGILNVREKINEHYAASNYNLDSDDIDMLEKELYLNDGITVNGDGMHYKEMIDYAVNNDLSIQDNFDYIESQMDVNEFLNYYIAEIYFENFDWPKNNIKYWRPHLEGGKWRWVMYDTDFGWGSYTGTGNIIIGTITWDKSWTRLMRALLENEDFYHEFVQRMAASINSVFNPDRIHPIYDSLRNKIDLEIDRHITRWGRPSIWTYNKQTSLGMPEFTDTRPDEMRTIMQDNFALSGMYNLFMEVNDSSRGYIQTCDIAVSPQSSGLFFNDIPLGLRAVPMSGYRFSHWEGASSSDNELISLRLSSDDNIRAVFKPDTPMSGVVINEVCASNLSGATDEYGQLADWIEIYNQNDFAVNLAGWFLSDSVGNVEKFRIPEGNPELTTVGAKDFLVIWCDGDTFQGPLHAGFKLKKEGETLSLVQKIEKDCHYVDTIRYPGLFTDMTFGRISNLTQWGYMPPTPLALNSEMNNVSLYINEYQSKNYGSIVDEYGEMDDWIEVYNASADTIDLAGLFFTDSLQKPLKHLIPGGSQSTMLPPYSYGHLWADNQPEQGPLHLGFKLDSKHEQIGVYQLGNGFLDSLTYSQESDGMVRGRFPDGSNNLQVLKGSPGEPNKEFVFENIFINEFMANNYSTIADETGEYDDWIELYNDNDYPVDIGGIFITDSLGDLSKFRIPVYNSDSTTIPAKSFLIVWADNQVEQGILHLDFKLSSNGEQIGIIQPDGKAIIDSLSYKDLHPDQAIGLLEDGGQKHQVLNASPGASNYVIPVSKLYISEIVASDNKLVTDNYGEYDDWIEIYNPNNFDVDIGGYYLTDSIGDLNNYYIPRHSPDSTTIKSGGYLVLWADNQPEQGLNHLGFRLSGKGEQLALVNFDGISIIDSLTFPDQHNNVSYSRLSNTGPWKFMPPTHGTFNALPDMSGIFINEFMASNTSFTDEYDEFGDWIEFYNANPNPVNLGGLYLTDSVAASTKYRIPSHSPELTTIPAKGYYLFYADDQSGQGVNHTNFKLGRKGEQIALLHYDESTIIDSLTYPGQYKNSSSSKIPDLGKWIPIPPTPLAYNEMPDYGHLVINEVMGYNRTQICDEYNEYDDWIELHNAGSESIDAAGLFLSNNIEEVSRFRISSEHPDSTTINPGGYLLLWADDQEEQGILHMNFKISKTGEEIGLYDQIGDPIDTLIYPFIGPNISWGRITDGALEWNQFVRPTPRKSNLLISNSREMAQNNAIHIYPNPVIDRAYIELELFEPGDLKIEIIDSRGSIVSLQEQRHHGNGIQKFEWDGTNEIGARMPEGIYFIRINSSGGIWIEKLFLK